MGLLVALIAVFYAIYRHTIWVPSPGEGAEAFVLLPVPAIVWYTAGWIVFSALVALLFATRPSSPTGSDLTPRRLTLLALGVIYAVESLARLISGHTFGLAEQIGTPALAVGGLAAGIALAALVRWPPPASWLLALLLGVGIALRLVAFRLVQPDSSFSDNLVAIERSLARLVAGTTPYTIHDFGTHVNPMGYPPLTFLSYLPPYLAGLDIRVTNVVLSTALTLALWLFIRALRLGAPTRLGFALLGGLIFVLPERVGKDVHTEWQLFNLALVLTFGLVALGRFRFAAAAFGVALGAMPTALYVAAPLLFMARRAVAWRELIVLAAIAALGGALPALAFLLWDPGAFLAAMLFGPEIFWGRLWAGDFSWPYLLLWHGWLGGWLQVLQVALFVLLSAISWFAVRTVRGLVGIAVASYLGLILTGPLIIPHAFAVILYLAVLAEAVAAAGVTAGDRALLRRPAPGRSAGQRGAQGSSASS